MAKRMVYVHFYFITINKYGRNITKISIEDLENGKRNGGNKIIYIDENKNEVRTEKVYIWKNGVKKKNIIEIFWVFG